MVDVGLDVSSKSLVGYAANERKQRVFERSRIRAVRCWRPPRHSVRMTVGPGCLTRMDRHR
jgi:hypothetical protein